MMEVVFAVQVRSAEMRVLRNLKVLTLSTQSPFMKRGGGAAFCFLKSMIISFVFEVLSIRLLDVHNTVSFRISSR